MTTFAGTSAVVQLYADEAGADLVRGMTSLVVSELARVEVVAAIWGKARTAELSAADAVVLVADFEADWFGTDGSHGDDGDPRFTVVRVTPGVLDDAARLGGARELRAYDAVQLASALAVRRLDPSPTDFCASDTRLLAAATAEGFATVGLLPPTPQSRARTSGWGRTSRLTADRGGRAAVSGVEK